MSNALPEFAQHDLAHLCLADAISLAQLLLADSTQGVNLADGDNIGASDPATSVHIASIGKPPLATFADHVVNVVLLCAKEQVIRTDTRPHVALVENLQAVWNRSVMQRPRCAVRHPRTPAFHIKLPISTSVAVLAIQPTAAVGVELNFGQKALKRATHFLSHFGLRCRGLVRGAERSNAPRLAILQGAH